MPGYIIIGGKGAVVGGIGGVGTLGNITLGTPVVTVGADMTQIRIPYTPPTPLGDFDRVYLFLQDGGFNEVPFYNNGVLEAGADEEYATHVGPGAQPQSKGVRFHIALDWTLVIMHPTPRETRRWRIIAVSGSEIRMNELPSSPFVDVTVSPPVSSPPPTVGVGDERAPQAASISALNGSDGWVNGVRYRTDSGGQQHWQFGFTWTNDAGPRYGQLGGYQVWIEYSDGARTSHASVDREDLRYESPLWPVGAAAPFTIYLNPFDTSGRENTIVPGHTKHVHVVVSPQVGGPGVEYAANVAGASVEVQTGHTVDGIARWRLVPKFTPPGDSRWGGIYLVLRPASGADVELGPFVGPGAATDWFPMGSAITYTVWFVSQDTNNRRNSIVDGTTPKQMGVTITPGVGQIAGGRLLAGSVSTDKLDSNQIDVGGGGGKPGKFRVFDSLGVNIGWIGTDGGNSGAWFQTMRVGGSSYATGKLRADSSGNLSIDDAVITLTSGSVSLTLNPNASGGKMIRLVDSSKAWEGYLSNDFIAYEGTVLNGSSVSGTNGSAMAPGLLSISRNGISRGFIGIVPNTTDSILSLADPAGTSRFFVNGGSSPFIQLSGQTVLVTRRTGWSTATGTATRSSFDTATVTLPQLAERVKALIDDLHANAGHGLIGA